MTPPALPFSHSGWLKRRSRYSSGNKVGTVAFNQKPVAGSWGGSNQFVVQMEQALRRWGYDVRYELNADVDVVFLVDPRQGEVKPFGHEEIADFKRRHGHVKVLQRINECDARKDTDFIDALLEEANSIADHTIFISGWLRDYHAKRWFDTNRPHDVIYNGADPAVFFPRRNGGDDDAALRLVTHHWSANWLKGFDVYQRLDEMIANGEMRNVELTVVGRWPDKIKWKAARTFGPLQGVPLADKLRENNAYITASRREPCGMHHVEGIQCGLPLMYHEDGGGIVEVGKQCGIGFRDSIHEGINELRSRLPDYRRRALRAGLSGERMVLLYMEAIHTLLFDGIDMRNRN